MRQLNFSTLNRKLTTFGGSLLKSGTHPKSARPLHTRRAIHLVLRSERSVLRLPRNFKRVNDLVGEVAKKHGVRIYEYANCGNHLHNLIKLPHRRVWNPFIRELTSKIAKLTGVRWTHRPFTRVLDGWGRAYRVVKDYVRLNQIETDIRLGRRETKAMLRRLVPLGRAAPG